MLMDVPVNGGLEIDDRVEYAALQAAACERREEALDGVDPRAEGVKWNTQRGWRASQARTLGYLWVP